MSADKYFEEVNTKVNFQEMEKEILESWYKNDIVDQYLNKNKNSEIYFSFLDGPITANNPMGVHHAWGRTYKDLWQRYKNMQGYKQRFQNGFDAQGLWVEVEVEKELGFESKKQIEEYGIERFVDKCKQRVLHYSNIQTEQSKRLGYFMDWENSYYTMSDQNNYMIWHFLKVCHENDWIYKGMDSVPWCPRCETAISQHEMLTEDYKEVIHESIYMAFPVVNQSKIFLLVWTTTPWTIPANIAIAVDKKNDYSLVKHFHTGNLYWVANELVKKIFEQGSYSVEKIVKGSELVGLKYKGLFDDLPAVKKVASENDDTFHTVIATDERIMPITTEEGTGLVHTAVSAGSEDFRLGQKIGLPMIPVIDDRANYLEGLDFLTAKNAKKDPRIILGYMQEQSTDETPWVFRIEKYKHRYPACWRCKTELVWKVTDEWYIAMDKPSATDPKNKRTLRERMIEVAKKIEWIPGFGLDREIDWLNNMHDWLISKKNRYWGLSLPIWECVDCGTFQVIGGKEELKEKAVKGWEKLEGKSPHKPQIDYIKIKCTKCGKLANRIEPVGNPWLDAGIVPYSTIAEDNQDDPLYLTVKEQWRKWFPADFITESFPGQFKNWFYSMIAMSTVLEDVNPFKTVLGFATLLAEDGRPMHKSWGNSIEFNEGADKIGADVMRWMYSRQKPSDNMLFGYKLADETRRKFHLKIWNTYNYFVTYANIDNWKPDDQSFSLPQSRNILDTWILMRFKQVLDITTSSLDKFDSRTAALGIEVFIEDLSNWYIRRSRARTGPSADSNEDKNYFYHTTYFILVNLTKLLAPFMPYMSEEIYKNLTKKTSVHLENWPEIDFQVESQIMQNMQTVRQISEAAHAQRKDHSIPVRQPLNSISVGMTDPSEDYTNLLLDEINVKKVNWEAKNIQKDQVELDTNITSELEDEEKTRSLIRKIQKERKKMEIGMDQSVIVTSPWIPEKKELLDMLKNITIAKEISYGEFEVKTTS